VIILSGIYLYENQRGYQKYKFELRSEAYGNRQLDPAVREQKLNEYISTGVYFYLAFLIPSLLLCFISFRKSTMLILVLLTIANGIGIIMLGHYMQHIVRVRF
jgi:hypothetical protein